MSFLHTNTLIELLRARLESLPLDPALEGGERLFQRVAVFGANGLAEAMKATFASEQRLAFIVPVGDAYTGERSRTVLFSQRSTSLVVLLADRAYNQVTAEAVVGGPNAIGILAMKDRVVDNLTQVAFATADLSFNPGEGEPLVIEPEQRSAGSLGRECWAQRFTIYAGEIRLAIP